MAIYSTKNDANIYKKCRMQKNLKQQDVATILNIDRSTISKWESGKSIPDQSLLPQIAELYNVSVDYLLGRTESPQGIALEGVYFRIASEAQEAGVPPEDIEKIIELYKKYKTVK